jgi:hypothetical protein
MTDLCRIMAKHGSDKGAFQGIGRHNYTIFYHQLLSDLRLKANAVFELGIGSTRPDISHTMGAHGTPGASLRGWREYFPNANIYSADIDPSILQPEYRIFKFLCDQTNAESIDALWALPETREKQFDLIIEDGLHLFEPQRLFMIKSLPKLKPSGIYICEDVPDQDFHHWHGFLKQFALEHPERTFELLKIDNPKNSWNSVVVIR